MTYCFKLLVTAAIIDAVDARYLENVTPPSRHKMVKPIMCFTV